MRHFLSAALVLLISGTPQGASIRITDSGGRVTDLKQAYVRYGSKQYLNTTTHDDEHAGLRVLQGDGMVTVRWTAIKEIVLTNVRPTLERYKHYTTVPEAQITLTNGKVVTAQAELGALRGQSELGEFSIQLANVKRIQLGPAQ